jgi:hypothetical protein
MISKNLPKHSVSRVFKLRDRLYDDGVLREYLGSRVDASVLDEMLDRMTVLLPDDLPRDLIAQSVQYLLGCVLGDDAWWQLCWRLAGNLHLIRNLKPVPIWNGQLLEEWCPVQIVKVAPYRTKRSNKVGSLVDVEILAGSPAGLVATSFWSTRFCHVVARLVGFSSRRGKHAFHHASQLYNMRCYVLIDPARSNDGPGFSKVYENTPGSLLSWNKDILRFRDRPPGFFECPLGYPKHKQCHTCHIGCDRCVAATHAATFSKERCERCDKVAWHDPEDARYCVACNTAKALSKPKEE